MFELIFIIYWVGSVGGVVCFVGCCVGFMIG